jgi:hypothetical protein
MHKTIFALAALGLATAAQAQVAGGAAGQVDATVEGQARSEGRGVGKECTER